MAHSSLLGIDRAPSTAPGHDSASLGPSDSSDSGSDVAHIGDIDDGDSMLPVDVATSLDRPHPDTSIDALGGASDTDAAGTGERRSAGGDGRIEDGADISPDRIVSDPNADASLDEEALLEDIEDIESIAAEESDEDEDEEEFVEERAAQEPQRRGGASR